VLSAKEENTLIAEGGIRAGKTALFRGALVQLTLIHGLLISATLAGIASAAIHVLAYLPFTIHEEICIPPEAALHLAEWAFPVAFLASFVGYCVWKAGPKRR